MLRLPLPIEVMNMKETSVQVINLNKYKFYIGGLPPKIKLTLHPRVYEELHKQFQLIMIHHPMLTVDNRKIPISPHDIIIIVNSEFDVCIMRTDFIYSKQTLKSKGMIVCKEVEVYHFNFDLQQPHLIQWESQILGK